MTMERMVTYICMAKRRLYSFWIDEEHSALLKAVRDRDGILPSEQIRRAVQAWLDGKQIAPKKRAAKKRGKADGR